MIKNSTNLIRYFYKEFPDFVKQMQNCDHNLSLDTPNNYHLEGSVFTHVMMIMKQIQQASYLTDYDKYIYSVIALCHDLGKLEARQIKDGKVTFYNHDAISAFKAIDVLNRLGLYQEEKEVIFQTIAHHTQVFRLTRQQLFDKLLDAKLRNTIETFGVFDHDGRFHDNQEVEKSYTLCEDLVVKYSSQNAPKTVTVMVGLPASGKSTYIDQNAPEGSFIVSRDRIVEDLGDGITYSEKWDSANQKEVDEILQEVFKQAKKENEVFVDMTHLSTKSRRRTLSHFGKEWKKKCVAILPSLQQLVNNSEERKNTTGKFVSDSVVLEMMSRFSSPTYGEGFDEIEWRF